MKVRPSGVLDSIDDLHAIRVRAPAIPTFFYYLRQKSSIQVFFSVFS